MERHRYQTVTAGGDSVPRTICTTAFGLDMLKQAAAVNG